MKQTYVPAPDRHKILIVGAGPVGLVAAAFLKKQGVSFDIIESRTGPVKDSRALGVHARTLEFMEILGIEKEFLARGLNTRYMSFHRYGKKLFSFDFSAIRNLTAYPHYMILPQSQTEDILVTHLAGKGVPVKWGHRLLNFVQTETGVEVSISNASGEGYSETYAYVLGADGASSTVRSLLNIEFRGETYPTEFLLSEVQIPGEKIDRNATHVYLGEKSTVAVIPQPDGCYRIVGPNFSPATDAGETSTRAVAVPFSRFRNFLSENRLFTDLEMQNPSRVLSYRMHKRVAKSFRSSRVFLAGDAAHIHSPAGGQGMNTGIHDAVNLTWKLSLVVKGKACDDLLDTYQHERMTFAQGVVSSTDKAMQQVMARNLKSYLLFDLLAPLIMRVWQPKALIASMAQLAGGYAEFYRDENSDDEFRGKRLANLRLSDGQPLYQVLGRDYYLLLLSGSPQFTAELETALHTLSLDDSTLAVHRLQNSLRLEKKLNESWHGAVLCRPDGYVIAAINAGDCQRLRHCLNSILLRGVDDE